MAQNVKKNQENMVYINFEEEKDKEIDTTGNRLEDKIKMEPKVNNSGFPEKPNPSNKGDDHDDRKKHRVLPYIVTAILGLGIATDGVISYLNFQGIHAIENHQKRTLALLYNLNATSNSDYNKIISLIQGLENGTYYNFSELINTLKHLNATNITYIVKNINNQTKLVEINYNNKTYITNYYFFNGTSNTSTKTITKNNNTTKTNSTQNRSLSQIIEHINQSEIYTFGTNGSLVLLSIENATPSSNGNGYILYATTINGKKLIVYQNNNMSEYSSGGVTRNITEWLNATKPLDEVLRIINQNNITTSGIVNLGNGSIDIFPDAWLLYVSPNNINQSQLLNLITDLYNNETITPLIATTYSVYNLPNAIWGYNDQNSQSVILQFPNQTLLNIAENDVYKADLLLGSNNPNPGVYGYNPIIVPLSAGTFVHDGHTGYFTKYFASFVAFSPNEGNGYQISNKILYGNVGQSAMLHTLKIYNLDEMIQYAQDMKKELLRSYIEFEDPFTR